MYPQLPDQATLAGLDAAGLRSLAIEFQTAAREAALANTTMDKEQHAQWQAARDTVVMLRALAADRDADELDAAQAAAHAAEIARLAAAEVIEPEAIDEPTVDPDDDGGDDGGAGGASGGGTTLSIPTGGSPGGQRQELVTVGSRWVASQEPGRHGPGAGQAFDSTKSLGAAIQGLMEDFGGNDPDRKITVASMPGRFRDEQKLSGDNMFVDWARISDPRPEEIEAAFCTPLQPLYDLSCTNLTSRPVYNGLPVFRLDADRGGFRVPTSPSLNDITTGYGQWTSSDDSNANALKVCQTIACPTWNDFTWYAVYRCLKVKNMTQAMTFPELVDSYLNRLQARWARYAEILLLEAMGTASTAITAPSQSYGANVSLQRTILSYLGKFADIERWDAPMMDAWMPRWLLWALRMDIASRRKDAGGMVPSVATVEQGFRDVGVEPHWFMDKPTWATPFASLAVSGTLTFYPSTVQILLHRRGKFALMDKGSLNVGLGGNPIRIEDDLRRNQTTFFFESMEGLINTDSCPAHVLTLGGLCYNGFQIRDKDIACEGYDMTGVAST